jgi:hypothetical protein
MSHSTTPIAETGRQNACPMLVLWAGRTGLLGAYP